ncbi:MAG: hypothetical protein M0Z84_14750 [Gammaproteobacteria bacterium]|nr:hypothetical protein [Gammaproteobacteria bacterium]
MQQLEAALQERLRSVREAFEARYSACPAPHRIEKVVTHNSARMARNGSAATPTRW